MTKSFALVLIVGIITSCASRTQVHVFSAGVDQQDVIQLSLLLEEQGFDARPNALPVPPNIAKHTVIFPAIVQDFATVELVESTMEAAGYSRARLVLEEEENHSYSTDNIGIYLVSPDYVYSAIDEVGDPYALGGDDATSLTYNYFSECPEKSEAQSELSLFPSGVALIEEFRWDENSGTEVNVIHDGQWRLEASIIQVDMFEKGELRFSLNEHTGTNWNGPFEALTLMNEFSSFDDEPCNYTHLSYPD